MRTSSSRDEIWRRRRRLSVSCHQISLLVALIFCISFLGAFLRMPVGDPYDLNHEHLFTAAETRIRESDREDSRVSDGFLNDNTTAPAIDSTVEVVEVASSDAAVPWPNSTSSTSTTPACHPHNSHEWLRGERYGNLNDTLFDAKYIWDMILDVPSISLGEKSSSPIFEQSLCHQNSAFLDHSTIPLDEKRARFWVVKLIYLIIHRHQHQPAAEEARERQQNSDDNTCASEREANGIGPFDFECPHTKFLVLGLGDTGLGSIMRTRVVGGLLSGLATNRTVVFLSNATEGPKSLKDPWPLVSCDRGDVQCFFQPITPCVVTNNDVQDAYKLSRPETRQLLKRGLLPDSHKEDRVLTMELRTVPPAIPSPVPGILKESMLAFLDHLPPDNPLISVIQRAAGFDLMNYTNDRSNEYPYGGRNSQIHQALILYAMRPNLGSERKLDQIMKSMFPADGFDHEKTLGLPIRASDKCEEESECLSFPQYMQVMSQVWSDNQHEILAGSGSVQSTANIVLTTESDSVMLEKDSFLANSTLTESMQVDFRIIVNNHDVKPNSGRPFVANSLSNDTTADDIMLSVVSALKAQLMAKYTIGNCCSSFHLLLFDLLQGGCGASHDSSIQCLQDNPNPEFRLCCAWSRSEECKAKRAIMAAQEMGEQ